MGINSLQAVQAYAQTALSTNSASGGSTASANLPTTTQSNSGTETKFSGLLTDAISQATGTIQAAENASARVSSGNGDLIDVVTSISTAEVSLEAAIAVRNKMIEAYQEIMRMPI